MQQFLAKQKLLSSQPTVLPDLAPCDFFLFPKTKLKLKGRRFDTTEKIQAKSQRVLEALTEKDFQGVLKMEEMVGPVSTCGQELLRG
jgi:hypothetical protein